ncbi:hypothetical protein D8674_026217 [Pyrus ussuriensis x Pyrus communis]|uniref:Uncharacterized protein n=1 Tax=Pyrus ussuriensis x Pyrus communis TaxID=2448454 RepID=A0A5N5I9B8_9ROSA|nr:hypothetical protein D8674_026217 [Pyrus ussuriensis x Pyrus communis]
MQIFATHCTWKWLFSPERFTNYGKDLATYHCLRLPIPEQEWVEAQVAHKKIYSSRSHIIFTTMGCSSITSTANQYATLKVLEMRK